MLADGFLKFKIYIGDFKFLYHYLRLKCNHNLINNKNYLDSFVSNYPLIYDYDIKFAERKIYCFWTGNNDLTENRKKYLELTKNNIGVEVVLVTPENLDNYIVDGYPLHPAYQFLSNVHKADYLRTYFMYHHGGGYIDIKLFEHDWNSAFDKLNKSDKWAIGYPELDGGCVAKGTSLLLHQDMMKYYKATIGNGAYIFKPYTPFAKIWIDELHKILDSKYDELKINPGNVFGDNEGYPIYWTQILGDIFHPLCLMYNNKILKSKKLNFTKVGGRFGHR